MQKSWTVISALVINLIVFGFYGFQGIYDSVKYYEAYRNLGFFRHWLWVVGMPLVAISSLSGLLKKGWAGLISSLAGVCFFLFMTYGFIDWHFDPMEQGRNGGVLYLAVVSFCLAGLNLGAFVMLFKQKGKVGES